MWRIGPGSLGLALAACLGAASAGAATLAPVSIERSVSLRLLEYPSSGGSVSHFDETRSSSAGGGFNESLAHGFRLITPSGGPESDIAGSTRHDSLLASDGLALDLAFSATESPLFTGGPSPSAQVSGGSSFSLLFTVDEQVDFALDYVLFGSAAPGAALLEIENLSAGGFLLQLASLGGGGGPGGSAAGVLQPGITYALRASANGYYCTCSREAPGGSVEAVLALTPIPEPGTAALLGLGLAGLGLRVPAVRRRPTRARTGTG